MLRKILPCIMSLGLSLIPKIGLGQVYPEVKIGTQVWMSKNLDVDTFRNGDKIPEAKTNEEWKKASVSKQPAWCYYDNDRKNGEKYGKLYNWYAVNDPRGLAPAGWHIPSDKEWTELTDFLGGAKKAGEKLRCDCGWTNNNNNSDNIGFNGVPAGWRHQEGGFDGFNSYTAWWSTTKQYYPNDNGGKTSYPWAIECHPDYLFRSGNHKGCGLSVRCIMEIENGEKIDFGLNTSEINTTKNINLEKVQIGSQIWMSKNLDVSTFRNGDTIPQAKTNEEWIAAGENKQPAWCYYDNKPGNGVIYGKLYNWFAVGDPRGLASKGWHIPSDEEWRVLTDYLGGESSAATKMKNTSGWEENGNGMNESGFSGLPGGLRYTNGTFYSIGKFGNWWSSTESNTDYSWPRSLYSKYNYVYRDNYLKVYGFSVRCIKDK